MTGENMKHNYKLLLTMLFVAIGILSSSAYAQDYTECSATEAECLVAYHNGDFVPYQNALRNTILNDTLNGERKHPDRVYVLETGGTYYTVDAIVNQGFHLKLRSQTEAEVGTSSYFGPARLQLKTDESGGTNGRLMTVQGDLTLEGLFITGMHDGGGTGNYLPIRISADNARVVVKDCIMEQTDFALFGFDSQNNKMYVYDSMFRNHINLTQQWEGRGLRFEAGADSLIIENSSFLNLGMTVIQSEAAPINYTRFVHNTVINVGRIFNTGNFWKEGYVANNLFLNHYWHGEGDADGINDGTREYPYTGFLVVGPIAPGFGFPDQGRRMVYTKNAHWRDPQFATYYSDTINAQPVINQLTDSMFTTFDATQDLGGFYYADNWEGVDPNVAVYHNAPQLGSSYPETEISLEANVPKMIDNIRDLREGRQSPLTYWGWDPGRNPSPATYSVQPLRPNTLNPGDFSYDNSTFLTAGTDGLPLGNLNYHDGARADWESNKAQYVSEIEALAGAVKTFEVVGSQQAEDGSLTGTAAEKVFDGFAYFNFESSGYVEWNFDLETAGTFDLNVLTNMNGNTIRGQRVIVNGTSIRDCMGWGEYIWDSTTDNGDCNPHIGMNINEWTWTRINNADLHAELSPDGLVLPAGANTIRLEPSWGYQGFAQVDVLDAGTDDVVASLTPLNADYNLVGVGGQTEMNGEEVEGIASGFKSVELGDNGTVAITFGGEEFDAGTYRIQVFYTQETDATVSYTINGTEIETATLTADGSFQLSSSFAHSGGTITAEIAGSDANIDFVDLIKESSMSTPTEWQDNVEGFNLSQNYPNPF
ncbi:MAG TPA: hypothetical protein DEQ34_02400, partial [Balneolaceae bacterium]|nr:hypothetical protein [Balneolaceae bacterium]